MIKLLILDLDNTLFDTYGLLGARLIDEMIKRMRTAGLTSEQEKILRKRYPYTGFRIIAKDLGLSDGVKKIGMSVYKDMDISHIKPYSDITVLSKIRTAKALVTSGTNAVQEKKVDILGIRALFQDILVDESSSLENKQKIFSLLAEKHKVRPDEVLVIGDNPESEIAAGAALGMRTVQILRRKGMIKGKADYHITDLHELKSIIKEYNKDTK